MALLPRLQPLVREVLLRVAFFSETHSIKGLLALDRMARRLDLGEGQIAELLELNQLLATPRVEGSLSEHCRWEAPSLEDRRLRSMLQLPVFPMAYLAAVEWARRRGVADLVEAFREPAIRHLDGLGHSWTIWCSFVELLPHLGTPEEEVLFAERLAELIGVQLRPGSGPKAGAEPAGPLDEPATRALALEHVGYLGHTPITLAYLYRHRSRLSAAELEGGLRAVHRLAMAGRTAGAHRVAPWDGDVDDSTLRALALAALEQGPREVHTLTAIDASHDLWDTQPDERTRRGVLSLLAHVRDLRVDRAPSGERRT